MRGYRGSRHSAPIFTYVGRFVVEKKPSGRTPSAGAGVKRASGATIEDVDGNRYIDYVGSWGPMIAGHTHPAVVEAAVVDRAGQVLVILRDEQATVQTVEMARRKAYTARMFRTSTLEFQKRTASDPTLAPQRDVSDILALGGGVPIQIGNEIIGGVGSSGSRQDLDDACAKAGVAKVADLLK